MTRLGRLLLIAVVAVVAVVVLFVVVFPWVDRQLISDPVMEQSRLRAGQSAGMDG